MSLHKELTPERWREIPLAERMGHIGSEVSRARNWMGKDRKLFLGAVDRALELFDLTLADPGLGEHQLREIARAREVFCDATMAGGGEYQSTLDDLDKYFTYFAILANS